MKKLLPLAFFLLGILGGARAQTCTTTISTFPYVENFDGATAPAGWVSGGSNSSWALGTPAKTVINSAASGTKSWVTSLTGNYNMNEQSYVESPCFNMSSLTQPLIELKVWWNCEFSYDGAVLQSSIDNGATWQVVGAKNDPNNWYTDNSINAGPGGQPVSTAQGWSGRNLSVNGSGAWLLAKHALIGLAGQPNVKLRIAFGSDGFAVDEGFAFDNFTVFDTPANDAGVTSITSPVSPVIPGSPAPLSVTVKNYGTSPLTAATFGFSVNGVVQPTFGWTGNLAPNAVSAPIPIGTFAYPVGVQKIKAWSKLPNAAADGNPSNDTTQLTINSCNPLSGNFTINKGAAASATNFTTISSAVQVIGNCGVSGPVTFNVVAGSGPYNEQVILPVIPGTSATNTVTFEGNGNTFTATPATPLMGIVTFNGADYVKINNFKVELDGSATSGWGFQLLNASDNNSITNCTINLPLITTSSFVNGIVAGTTTLTSGAGNYANNLLIQNNVVNGGWYGILLNGVISGAPTYGNRILNNQLKDAANIGIQLNNGGTGTIVEGNDISRANRIDGAGFTGIYLAGNNINTIVNKNRIHNTHDAIAATNNIVYGIQSSSVGTVGNENIVKNNLIYNINNAGGTFYGLFASTGTHYYHNTVLSDPATSYSSLRGVYIQGAVTNVKVINNIFSLAGQATSKHAIYIASTTASVVSNYNDLYVGATGNIGYYSGDKATLANWQAVNTSAYDQNSISVDPLFVSGTYLQPLASALNNAGQALPAVTDAFNGVVRSATTPDIGAYEFTPAVNDAGVTAINAPTSPTTPGSQAVQVTLKNFGSAALTSATISWKVNNVTQPNFAWTGTIASQQTSTLPINIGSFNFATGNYIVKVWSQNPNSTTDQLAINDTTILNINACAPLIGNYTVNKNNPTAGTNFHSLSEVAERLTSCGVSGPVTITVVAGTGPYNEQVEIGAIPFTSATNTVTFEGSGNTVSVMPGFRPGVFVLNGTRYTKLNNFIIELPATAINGWGVQLMNAADYNTVSNNTINLPQGSSDSNLCGIVTGVTNSAYGNNASYSKFQNNIINGGYYGIIINGNTGGLNAVNNQITGNQLKDQYSFGIQVGNANGTLIEGNDLSRPTRTSVGVYYGINLNLLSWNTIISKNRIHNTHDVATSTTSTVYAFYITATPTLGNENIIKNNLIYNINNNGGSLYVFTQSSASNTYYYHNTVATNPSTNYVTLRGFVVNGAVTNVKFINNNLYMPSSGTSKHIIYIASSSAGVVSNNNNLFVGSSGNVGYFSTDLVTLANWKTANVNAYDQNSFSVNPGLMSLATGDLKPTIVALDNTGQPLAAVTDDILGAARNAATPDMGAYEFGVPANDVGIIAISGPSVSGCGLTATENITVTIRNFGAATHTTIPVTYSLDGTLIPATENFTGSLAPNATATYTFTAKANLATTGAHVIIAKTLLPGDLETANDADTLEAVNSLIPGMPTLFDFETVATGISRFRKVTGTNSNITEDAGASISHANNPFIPSTKGLILDGVDNINWVIPGGSINPFTTNLTNFAGAYICIIPNNFAYPDSMWMTFDLKQLYKVANVNTNFRVTLNGTQVGPTYRPPFTGTPINWQEVKVDLTAFKNAPILMIGLESSAKEAYANGTGTANLVDNIQFRQYVTKSISGMNNDLQSSQIHVFPNPSNGTFNIDLPNGKTYELEVTDLTGKVLQRQKTLGKTALKLQNQTKGIYLLKVSGENGSAVRKLIVE